MIKKFHFVKIVFFVILCHFQHRNEKPKSSHAYSKLGKKEVLCSDPSAVVVRGTEYTQEMSFKNLQILGSVQIQMT